MKSFALALVLCSFLVFTLVGCAAPTQIELCAFCYNSNSTQSKCVNSTDTTYTCINMTLDTCIGQVTVCDHAYSDQTYYITINPSDGLVTRNTFFETCPNSPLQGGSENVYCSQCNSYGEIFNCPDGITPMIPTTTGTGTTGGSGGGSSASAVFFSISLITLSLISALLI